MVLNNCVDVLVNYRTRPFKTAVSASKHKRCGALAFVALAAASMGVPAWAADVNWDNGSSNFSWDTTSLNWTGAAWNNAAGNGAIFGATGVGAISVPGPINVNSMNFTVNGYSLNGTGPFTFVNGVSTQTTGVINTPTGISAQINVPINSAVGFQKIGPGVLELTAPGSYTGVIPLDPRGSLTAGLLIGGSFGTIDGGTLRVTSSSVIPATTTVSIGQGYLDIGSNTVTLDRLNFTNQNPSKPWNTILNANNGVVGNGTLRVLGEIGVLGALSDNSGNTIAANVDLGGGTQIVRVGVVTFAAQERAMMLTGVLSNGSLLKTFGYNQNGVLTNTDGMSLLNNNTYTGSTVLNAGITVMTGTNATSSIKIIGQAGGAVGSEVRLQGANGSAQSATLLQAFEGGNVILDNNAALGAAGFNQPNIPAAQNNDRIRDDAAVELRYGSFTYRGLAGSTTASETFGSMNVLGGHNTVTILPNNVGAATVTGTGNLTMAPRATLQVQTLTTGTGNGGNLLGGNAQLKFNGTVPAGDATGILPRTVSNADFLTYNGTTGFTPFTGYATDFSTAGTNVTNAASTTVASSVNINALRSTAAGNTTITIGAGQTLGITSGMILNSGFGGLTVTGGVLDFGSNPGVLFATGATTFSGTVTGSAGLIHARGTATYAGDFSGLTGPVDVYSGTANINTNTMSSPINIRGGQLNINVSQTAGGLGAIRFGVPETDSNLVGQIMAISISGAGANAIIDRDLIVENGTTNAAGVALTYRQAPGLSPLSNTTGSQTWSGDITLNTSLRLQGGGASATSTGATNFTGDISGPGTFFIPNGRANFSGNYSNTGGFNLGDQGFSMKVAFLGTPVGSAPITISGGNGNTVSYNAGALPSGLIRVRNSDSGITQPQIIPLQTSTINNTIFLDNSFASGGPSGVGGHVTANVGAGISATWAGPITGVGALTKIGTGDLILSSNASTNTGAVIVNAGALKVNGSLPASTVTVNNTGILGGTGALSGAVTVNTGGEIAPGNSIGNFSTGNLSLFGSFESEIDLNNGGPPSADLLNVNGTVNLNAATAELLLLNAPPAPSFAGGKYLLLANDGIDPVVGTFNSIVGLPLDYVATVDYAFSGTDSLGRIGTGNDIAVTLVPEPAALGVLAMMLPLLRSRRRRPGSTHRS